MKKDNTSPFNIPYSAAREKTEFKARYGLFINGAFRAPLSRKYFSSINPATKEILSQVADLLQKYLE